MPDARISELPAATAPNDTDLSALVQPNAGGLETRRATIAQLRGAVLSGRAAHVRDYGAVGDSTTNDAPAIQAAVNDLATRGGGTLMFGARRYRLASAITIGTTAVTLQGQGFTEGPNAADGTWLLVDQTGFTPITFTGVASRGSALRDIAFRQTHTAALNASWAPNAYDYLVRVQDCLGGIEFDNVFMANANRGIYCNNSGRLYVNRLRGQVFTAGIEIDNALDVPRLQNLHLWPFWSGDANVVRYTQNTCDAVILRRCDGAFIDAAFVLPARSMFRLTAGAAGTATKIYIGTAYADFVRYAVLMEADGCDALVDSLTSNGEYFGSGGTPQAGAIGIYVTASNTRLQVGKLRIDHAEDNAIRVEGTGNRLDLGALRCVAFNSRANNSAAVHLADSGTSTPNACYLAAPPLIEGATGPLGNGGSNGILSLGATAGTAARPGLSLGTADTGLFAPATGIPALAAAGQEVLRATGSGGLTLGGAPNAHAFEVATPLATTNRLLVTGSATGSAVQLAAAGGDANVSLQLSPKGSGQLLGVTPAGTDNSTALATTAYVRAQGYAPLASPSFTGTPVVPGYLALGGGTLTGALVLAADPATALGAATRQYVDGRSGVTTVAGRSGAVTLAVADVAGAAPLASPSFTGTPVVPGYLALGGGTLTGALLANSGGGGNQARLTGAASGSPVFIGVDPGSADANVGAVLGSPKGTGALSAQQPDSAATGGNARGANAVDWQSSRTTAAQVASGTTAVVGGGLNNTASGTAATVAGGSSNTASAGNSAVAGGNNNNASGTAAAIGGGANNLANGNNSAIPGGTQGNAHGLYGAQVFASGLLAAQGDAQSGLYVLRGRSTAGAAVRLTADNAAAGSANVANIPLNTAWSGDLVVTARETSTGNCCRWRIPFGMGVVATAATLAYAEGTVDFANIIGAVAASTALVRTADTTVRGLNLTFTPPNGNTWDVVAVIRTAEVQ